MRRFTLITQILVILFWLALISGCGRSHDNPIIINIPGEFLFHEESTGPSQGWLVINRDRETYSRLPVDDDFDIVYSNVKQMLWKRVDRNVCLFDIRTHKISKLKIVYLGDDDYRTVSYFAGRWIIVLSTKWIIISGNHQWTIPSPKSVFEPLWEQNEHPLAVFSPDKLLYIDQSSPQFDSIKTVNVTNGLKSILYKLPVANFISFDPSDNSIVELTQEANSDAKITTYQLKVNKLNIISSITLKKKPCDIGYKSLFAVPHSRLVVYSMNQSKQDWFIKTDQPYRHYYLIDRSTGTQSDAFNFSWQSVGKPIAMLD